MNVNAATRRSSASSGGTPASFFMRRVTSVACTARPFADPFRTTSHGRSATPSASIDVSRYPLHRKTRSTAKYEYAVFLLVPITPRHSDRPLCGFPASPDKILHRRIALQGQDSHGLPRHL